MLTFGEMLAGVAFTVILMFTGEIMGEVKAKEQIINTLLDRVPKDEDLKRKLEDLKQPENSVL